MSSVLLSVGGIVLMGHGEGFENPSTLGILYAALAALMSAIFQVIIQPEKITEKVLWRSAFWTIWHCILNADSTKTPSSTVTF